MDIVVSATALLRSVRQDRWRWKFNYRNFACARPASKLGAEINRVWLIAGVASKMIQVVNVMMRLVLQLWAGRSQIGSEKMPETKLPSVGPSEIDFAARWRPRRMQFRPPKCALGKGGKLCWVNDPKGALTRNGICAGCGQGPRAAGPPSPAEIERYGREPAIT